jgi:hypothetical protein
MCSVEPRLQLLDSKVKRSREDVGFAGNFVWFWAEEVGAGLGLLRHWKERMVSGAQTSGRCSTWSNRSSLTSSGASGGMW